MVAEQSTVPPLPPSALELLEDPELPDEPEPPEELEEPPFPDGAVEDWDWEGWTLDPDPPEADPDVPRELPEAGPGPDAAPEVDPSPSPPLPVEWLDDEHAASATTAALRNEVERSLMAGILPKSADEPEGAAAVYDGTQRFRPRETGL
jgi:hypothetical protein